MMRTNKGNSVVIAIVIVAIALIGFIFMYSQTQSSAVTTVSGASSAEPTVDHFVKIDGALKVASSSPYLSVIASGTCTLTSDSSIAATSTGTGTCATTGSQVGDQVMVSFSTTTTKMSAQYVVAGTVAASNSTTVRLINLTGVAGAPAATNGFGSSTQYWIFRSN